MASSDRELAEQLREAGNLLLSPPSSVDELLPLLDQVENCLSRVEQSPSPPMQNAISPSLKALVTEQLFRHPDADVKVAVASCISEITRITAPEAPYDDDKMKEVFQLIVSSFENLFDNTSRSYSKRTSILETVAKVRSCVVMLDLECDALIIEMFQHLLKSIRDYHPENVFQCMETIMTLVLEESEDISTELLSPLLASVKRDDEEVLPVARKLAEKVFESCATKLKPYLIQAVNKLGISFDDYSKVVSSICQESSDPVEQNDATANEPVADDGKPAEGALDEKAQDDKEISGGAVPAEADLKNEKSLKSVVSNGIPEPEEDKTSNSLKKQHEGQPADQAKNTDASSTAEPDNLATEKLSNSESKVEKNTKKRGKSSTDGSHDEKEAEVIPEHKSDGKDSPGSAPEHQSDGKDASGAAPEEEPIDAGISSANKKETVIQPSSPKTTDSKSADVASPTASGNLPDENNPEMMERLKKKESLVKDKIPADDASKKTSEGTSDSEAKPNRRSGKKVAAGKSNEEKTTTVTDEMKKESGTATDVEAEPVKQAVEEVAAINNNADESASKQQKNKKKRSRGKGVSEKDETKTSTKNEEKETVASPKSVKPNKDEPHVEKTPKNNLKRKLTPGKDKVSGSIEYGENLVGSKIKVWWPIDKTFYEGVIDSFDSIKKKHKILYNDGEREILNLKREKWEFIQDDSESDEEEKAGQASPESSSDMPLKKKAKTTEQSTKQAKMDTYPKTGAGGSSSKSKGKSNRKSKDDGKVDSKSKDGSRTGNKSEDDNASRSKDHKAAGKSEDTLSMLKTSSKLKQDKSKHETPKPSSTATGKPRKSGGKSNPNGTGKSKSGSSKVKESENVKENSTESAEGQESVKGKPASSSKSGKKRRR